MGSRKPNVDKAGFFATLSLVYTPYPLILSRCIYFGCVVNVWPHQQRLGMRESCTYVIGVCVCVL